MTFDLLLEQAVVNHTCSLDFKAVATDLPTEQNINFTQNITNQGYQTCSICQIQEHLLHSSCNIPSKDRGDGEMHFKTCVDTLQIFKRLLKSVLKLSSIITAINFSTVEEKQTVRLIHKTYAWLRVETAPSQSLQKGASMSDNLCAISCPHVKDIFTAMVHGSAHLEVAMQGFPDFDCFCSLRNSN